MDRSCETALQGRVGYRFRDAGLLREALTHKSYANEHPGNDLPHNERLEFLGDAVLDLVISTLLFRQYPGLSEGELTRIRAELVREPVLAAVARTLGIGDCLLVGRGEGRSGGRDKDSLLADALEAVFGALFCDGGLAAASETIQRLFASAIERSARRKTGIDFKTRLQELLQARHGRPPEYLLVATEGPDHERWYTVEVRVRGEAIGRGRGRSKKAAEQDAAQLALAALEG